MGDGGERQGDKVRKPDPRKDPEAYEAWTKTHGDKFEHTTPPKDSPYEKVTKEPPPPPTVERPDMKAKPHEGWNKYVQTDKDTRTEENLRQGWKDLEEQNPGAAKCLRNNRNYLAETAKNFTDSEAAKPFKDGINAIDELVAKIGVQGAPYLKVLARAGGLIGAMATAAMAKDAVDHGMEAVHSQSGADKAEHTAWSVLAVGNVVGQFVAEVNPYTMGVSLLAMDGQGVMKVTDVAGETKAERDLLAADTRQHTALSEVLSNSLTDVLKGPEQVHKEGKDYDFECSRALVLLKKVIEREHDPQLKRSWEEVSKEVLKRRAEFSHHHG